MITRNVLAAIAAPVVLRREATRIARLDEPAEEHDVLDARRGRQIHGLTAPELAARHRAGRASAPRAFDAAARLVRGEADPELAALAAGPVLRPHEALALVRAITRTP